MNKFKQIALFASMLAISIPANAQWTQVGEDIDGEAAEDNSGQSISLSADGSVVAIGVRLNNGNGRWSGHVRVYKDSSGTWTQIGSDIDGEAAFNWSGSSVSLSSDGSVVAMGAPVNGASVGHARVYKNTSGTWIQVGSDIDGEAMNDVSGDAVSLSSDGFVVAIGASLNDGNGIDAGHVRVYRNAGFVGIDELDDASIKVYPNPTKGNITIEREAILSITITDASGKLIQQKTSISSKVNIDLSTEAKGIYFVTVKTNKGIITKEIVLE